MSMPQANIEDEHHRLPASLRKMHKCFDGYVEAWPVRQYRQHLTQGPFAVEIVPALISHATVVTADTVPLLKKELRGLGLSFRFCRQIERNFSQCNQKSSFATPSPCEAILTQNPECSN